MPRQHALTKPITADDVFGNATEYGIVRITRWEESPGERVAIARWEIGRLDEGVWDPSGLKGFKEYRGSDYLELIGDDPPEMHDRVYLDLVSGGTIGTGTQEDYGDPTPPVA
jgi:hypothetical protein